MRHQFRGIAVCTDGGDAPFLDFFFQAEDGIRDGRVTGVQTCALPISADATTGRGKRLREKEPRLALVCYGGVSLAVYMHGITGEIWRLTRASRAFHDGEPRSEERRVGKECRTGWWTEHSKNNNSTPVR